MTRPQTGDRINNYLLDERIGQGAFGDVWKAHHHVFGDLVAIKFPTHADYVRHLRQEGVMLHGLDDPRIVRGLDLDPYGDPPYLIMEYVNGPSLRQVLDLQPNGLSLEQALIVTQGVLSALRVAHAAGFIHRDIKPANVLLAGGLEGLTPDRVKLTDFGLGYADAQFRVSMMQSTSMDADDRARLTGTMAYMSPEQRDGRDVDGRSDLYSVGVVLHEMITGHLPHGSDRPSAWREGVPAWVDDLFGRTYCSRERRFPSAEEMLSEIEKHSEPDGSEASSRSNGKPKAVPGGLYTPSARVKRINGQRRCVKCEGQVLPEDHFCVHCGFQLVDEIPRCPTCHAFVGLADHYCIRCGTDLREG